MSCDPNALLESAKCFCFGSRQSRAVRTHLLCQWAGGGPPPVDTNYRITNLMDFRVTNAGDIRIWA